MERTPDQLYALAKAQKMILWCLVANLGINAFSAALGPMGNSPVFEGSLGFLFVMAILAVLLLFVVVILIAAPYYTYRVAKELGSRVPLLWAPLMLIPLINLVVLLVLSSRATKVLRAHGYKVGLMGADLKAIPVALSEEK